MTLSFADQCFLDAGTAIDNALNEHVLSRLGELSPTELLGIYEKLTVTMAYNSISVALTIASSVDRGLYAVDRLVERLPRAVSEGKDRAIQLGLDARNPNPQPNRG